MARRRKPPEGFGRLAAALASSDEAAPRIESRLVRLTITTRWVTIVRRASSSAFSALAARPLRGRGDRPGRVRGDPELPPAATRPRRPRIRVPRDLRAAPDRHREHHHRRSRQPVRAHARSPACCSPATCGAGARLSAPRSRRDRGRGHDRDAVGRRDRPSGGRPDRGRVPAAAARSARSPAT